MKSAVFPHSGVEESPAALFKFCFVCSCNSPGGLLAHLPPLHVTTGPTQQDSCVTGRRHSMSASSDKGDNKRKSIQYAKASYTFSGFFP